MSEELKPCPFCGGKARMLGGPMAQERYSVWCENRHHITGGMDAGELALEWNARHVPEGYALVPVEPTGKQREVFEKALNTIYNPVCEEYRFLHYWKAMIAAAQDEAK